MNAWLLALLLAHGADAASTCAAMAHGAREANPLLPNSCVGVSVVQASVGVSTVLLLRPLAKDHPKWFKGLTFGLIATKGVAVTWNLSS